MALRFHFNWKNKNKYSLRVNIYIYKIRKRNTYLVSGIVGVLPRWSNRRRVRTKVDGVADRGGRQKVACVCLNS
jgi:hypothetical protein